MGILSTAIATIGGGLFNLWQRAKMRRETIEDRDYENWYNSPAQQVARLKGAGFSASYLYGGGAANQSASTSPTPPAEEPFTKGAQIAMALEQASLQNKILAEDLTSKKLLNKRLEEDVNADLSIIDDPESAFNTQQPASSLVWKKRIALANDKTQEALNSVDLLMRNIDFDLKDQLARGGYFDRKAVEEITALVLKNDTVNQTIKNMKQDYESKQAESKLREEIQKLATDGTLSWKTLGAILYQLFFKNASVSGLPGFNID